MIEVESLIETIATADETASEVFDAEKRAPSVPLYIPPWKTTVISSLVENKAWTCWYKADIKHAIVEGGGYICQCTIPYLN